MGNPISPRALHPCALAFIRNEALFFVRVAQPLERLIYTGDRRGHVMCIRQSTLKCLKRDVRVLVDQLDQKTMVRGQPPMPRIARVPGRRQVPTLPELLEQAQDGCQ